MSHCCLGSLLLFSDFKFKRVRCDSDIVNYYYIFRTRLCATSFGEALDIVWRAVEARSGWFCLANVDMVTRARRSALLRDVMMTASAVFTDSAALRWSLLYFFKLNSADHVNGPALMLALCERSEANEVPIFLYGGSEYELQLLGRALMQRFPKLRIVGAHSPGVVDNIPDFDEWGVDLIKSSGAHLVFVGLGCPKQEHWIGVHRHSLDAVLIGVGLAFAQNAGLVRRAPDWVRRVGCEWLFRLMNEPRRLWRRYLIGNCLFLVMLIEELWDRTLGEDGGRI